MNIIDIFQLFSDQESCIKHLEKVRWASGKPQCPYCFSIKKITKQKNEHRYHCNNCNCGFSVTVNTIFHDSKVPLQKWFVAISLILGAKKGISAKQIERDINVTYKTAWYMAMRIRRAMIDQKEMLMGIIEVDETYVGGKPRKFINKNNGPKNKRGRGTKKISVIGLVERNGNVYAQIQKKIESKSLSELNRRKVNSEFSMVLTDEFKGYNKLKILLLI